jgi:reactive intermediate/imine deaminase
MSKRSVVTSRAPRPAAQYSQGVQLGNIVQTAGQIPLDPGTGNLAGSSIGEQTRQVFHNVGAVLEAAGASFDDVIMLRVYLADWAHFAEMNSVYSEFITDPAPARTTVCVNLPFDFLVEIDALAVLPE